MGKVPVYVFNQHSIADNKNGLVSRSENPVLAKVMEERRRHFRQPQDIDPSLLERVVLQSRVLIVEGISGSGKDTFQTYLKNMIKGRDVHDYSEGEVLLSWNQLQIEGIAKLRVKFMKLFLNYIKDIVSSDENSVFLLNRFHLSAYVMTITQQPQLQREYDEIIDVMRTLPVHVFVLQMDENEIETRTLHPERSSVWQNFQQQILKKEGFSTKLERYTCQQRSILETAESQQLPYSVIKLPSSSELEGLPVRVPQTRGIIRRRARTNSVDAKFSQS
jgi:hypothetical protein